VTTGQPMIDLPHARIAGGPSTLVILEGLTLENKAPTGLVRRLILSDTGCRLGEDAKALLRAARDASDYIATIEADLGHDATDALSRIAAPTLVIAGSRDFFYPDPIVRETAERIPQATLRLYDGVGHAVSKTHKRRFEDDVLGFLRS
jgi:pimeloyl-ACP methyl ester carboxylesterase